MLLVVLGCILAVYGVIGRIGLICFRGSPPGPNFAIVWASVMAICWPWVAVWLVPSPRSVGQLLTFVIFHPNEDVWAQHFGGLLICGVIFAPAPVALAGLFARPSLEKLRRPAVLAIFAVAVTLLAALHFTYHRTAILTVIDQFDQPVADAKIEYYLDGRTVRRTDDRGQLRIPFYHGVHRFDFVEAMGAGYSGYRIDHRACSAKPFDPIPDQIKVSAWKVLCAPKLLSSGANVTIVTDGRPYFINLVRGT